MYDHVSVNTRADSDEMMRPQGGGVFPGLLMRAKPRLAEISSDHVDFQRGNEHALAAKASMRNSANTPPQERGSDRIMFFMFARF